MFLLDLDAPFRVVLEGNSLDTKVLIGPVDVWRVCETT